MEDRDPFFSQKGMYLFASVLSAAIYGMEVREIQVEADVSDGLPSFAMVGFPSAQVREAQERVRTAFKNNRLCLPPKKVTVNFAPADMKKEGAGFDLPVAAAVLAAAGILEPDLLEGVMIVGEISLNGEIHGVAGVLPRVIRAREMGLRFCVIPEENIREGNLVKDMPVFGVKSLNDMIRCLRDPNTYTNEYQEKEKTENKPEKPNVDFADICGQEGARRAAEIAVSGFHNILFIGPPGSGKTMLARRLPTIMPEMTFEESLEITKVYSVAGLLTEKDPLIRQRPFRSPHHTSSPQALAGGGRIPGPGEITLAHRGVLFLDEMPEFSRKSLEILRQPLEDGYVTISRVQASLTFPANFIMCTAQNPCPCGYLGDKKRECSCKQFEIERYHRKLSGPLLDRIDLQVYVPRLEYADLQSREAGESSAVIRERVIKARQLQLLRLQGTNLYCNEQMGRRELNKHCQMEAAAEKLLAKFFTALGLSARSHDRIIKVARTIADLDGSDIITAAHLAEAVQLRTSLNS